jgi:hypothetical protein
MNFFYDERMRDKKQQQQNNTCRKTSWKKI